MMEKENESGRGLLYEVPEELKHEEKIFWVFSFKQAMVFAAFLLPAFVVFQLLSKFDYRVRIGAAALLVFTGFVFASVKQVQEALVKTVKFSFAPKKGNWMQPEVVSRYVGVQDVRGDVAFMQDGRLLSILLVTPIDYSVLSEEQKMALVHGYRSFLNSLSFPVQIVMRTAKVNLKQYFAAAKSRAAGSGDTVALVELERFEEFVEEFVAARGVNDRLFYLVVPQEKLAEEGKALRELDYKLNICVEKLSSIGLVAKKLSEGSLVGLYASFFGGYIEVDEDYLSVLTMLDFACEYEKLCKVGETVFAKSVFLGLEGENGVKKTVGRKDVGKQVVEQQIVERHEPQGGLAANVVAVPARAFKRGKQR